MKHLLLLLIAICAFSCTPKMVTTNYYFDSQTGDDANTGTSADAPFHSLSKLSTIDIRPGDSILLKANSVFTEKLYLSCNGTEKQPIVLGKYGGEGRPHIAGDGADSSAVHIYNSDYLTIRDLEISNQPQKPIPGINGLHVQLRGYGVARNITVDNIYVHNVLGSCTRTEKDGGHAILMDNYDSKDSTLVSSRFDNLMIQNCLIKDCQRSGIIFFGNWIRRHWNPSTNVVIRHNVLDGVPGDGIVPVGCDGVLVEYNVMKNCPPYCPVTEAADGIWPWSCDNALVQYNVVSDHKSPVDGYGFDSDWNSRNTVFQYNLSFNNDGGFLLVCNSGGWPLDWCVGNVGTIARYNISINDGLRNYKVHNRYFSPVIHCTGPILNTTIEKNLFYIYKKPEPQIDKTILCLDDWGGYADSTYFRNNYIFVEEGNLAVEPTRSTHNFYQDNLFIGALKTPAEGGFSHYNGAFTKEMWYGAQDENWKKLLEFVQDKTVPINEQETKVTDIIGWKK